MKKRFVANSEGVLVARDGQVLGSVVGITIELEEGEGGDLSFLPLEKKEDPPVGESEGKSKLAAIANVWAYYQAVIPGASRQTLESKRATIIRNALKVRDEDTCLRAIDGLAASPHHNGQNEQRKKYLALRYALKGIGAESNDERIDNMAAKAAPISGDFHATFPTEVKDRMRKVEMMLLRPEDRNLRARAGNAQDELRARYGLQATLEEGSVPMGKPFVMVGDVARHVEWVRASTAAPEES
jgi:hypothetical protein